MTRRQDCPVCGGDGFVLDEHTRLPIAKCTSCTAPPAGLEKALASPDAERIRRAIVDRSRVPGEFAIEDVTEAAFGEGTGLGNVVGAVTAALAKEELIRRVGYRAARRATRAGATVSLWLGRGDPSFGRTDGA